MLEAERRNPNGGARDEFRMPESRSRPSSPGVPTTPAPSPPKARRRRTTAAEAYNKGLLLQYLLESCEDLQCCVPEDSTSEEYYERNWRGHQPLASPNWDVDPEHELCAGSSPAELRRMRWRRRRGMLGRGAIGGGGGRDRCCFAPAVEEDVVPLAQMDNIRFPVEVADPHLVPKKKWQPDCAHAAANLPLPPHRRKDAGGCALMPGCDSGCA